MIPLFNQLKKNLKKDVTGLPLVRIALLGDSATQLLATAIMGMGIDRGFKVDLFEAEYNQIERLSFDPNSELYNFNPDFVIVFQSTHKLLLKYSKSSPDKRDSVADDRLSFIDSLCNLGLNKIIYFNYPEIDDSIFGNFSNKLENSFIYQVRKLNFELMNLSQRYKNLFICDILSLQNTLGRQAMFDSSAYINADMVFSIEFLPYVASRIFDTVSAVMGKFKKCLILDLDNTLWGGVIGDDGLQNIQIGNGIGIGKAFSEFQLWIKKLKDRGVILAVCSKNDEIIAKEPFLHHPDMILKLDDIAVFLANWQTKVDNIKQIQSILNIGFDSIVFLDDNPFERNIVKDNIPGISVPELPTDPADYLEFLYGLNLFETASFSINDVERTKQYQQEAERTEFKKTFFDEADFLKSLGMTSEISSFTKFNIPRVAQLIQRSNQFNLRTIRYSESELEQFTENEKFECFTFTLNDKFGNNGLIAVIILEKQSTETLFIDTWLMSCRILKRGMEDFILNKIVNFAKENGFRKLIGEYIPTPKNKMVENHYLNLDFVNLNTDNEFKFELQIETYNNKVCFINEIK